MRIAGMIAILLTWVVPYFAFTNYPALPTLVSLSAAIYAAFVELEIRQEQKTYQLRIDNLTETVTNLKTEIAKLEERLKTNSPHGA